MLRDRRVLAIAARPQMNGDTLALAEDFNAANRQPRLDFVRSLSWMAKRAT
jgi:hypothetical protein